MQIAFIAAVLALAAAKPELYKENEEFQYSRSSSDEGTKSGFYGAQRGNMGGNYERAHNMDATAQNQMGGLVRQVDGELGKASDSKTGSVFASANSRGIYGSGNYDLSNLQGRNFREGTSYIDSTSAIQNSNYQHASSHSTGYHNANTHASTQQGLGYYVQNSDATLANKASSSLGSGNYGHTGQSSQYHRESGYNSESGYQGNYGQSNSNLYGSSGHYGSNVKSRLVSNVPVKVVIRPGGRVAVPIAAQTYDSTHRDSASRYENQYMNSEAADLNSVDSVDKPTSTGKHYESSYKYQKEWETHDTKPAVVPLALPAESSIGNSDLYNNNYHSEHEKNSNSGYNVKSSSQAHRQSNYNTQQYDSNSINSNAYKHNSNLALKTNQDALTEVLSHNKPSNYQSSYSYHKSWERQGDPYVIEPVPTNNQASQRLYASNQHYLNAGCCETNGYAQRLTRSIGQEQEEQIFEDVGQQVQNSYDFSQQSQNLDSFEQQSKNLVDFGQQQQTQNLEDFGQHTQNLESFSQQSQNLENFGQQQSQNLEDFGQQTQNLETFSQKSQNLEDFGQQTQNLETFSQKSQNLEDFGQQTQKLEDFGQQTQHFDTITWNNNHKISKRSDYEKYKNLGLQTQEGWKQFKAEGNWANKDAVREKKENEWHKIKKESS